MANNLAIELGMMNINEALRIKILLEKYNIPTSYKIKNVEDFYKHFFLDKKSLDDKIKFILPIGIGDCKIIDDAPKSIVLKILR